MGKIHKAWIIMGGACLLMMTLALVTTCLGFFTQPVAQDLGFERGKFTLYYSVVGLSFMVSLPVWGKLIPKVGIKMAVAIGGALAGLGLIGLGSSSTLTAFYLIAIPVGFGAGCTSLLPAGILINNWFEKKKGLAMGITFAFSGVGGAIFSPILANIIANQGWRTGYYSLGIAVLILTIPVAITILKAHPSEDGLTAYGALEQQTINKNDAELTGIPSSIATKSLPFLALFMAILSINVVGGCLQHIPAHLASSGIPAIMVGSIISILMIVLIASKVLLGISNDKFGEAKASIIHLFIFAAGMVLLSRASDYTMALIAAIVFGFGLASTSVLAPLLTAKIFGQRDYNSIYSLIGMSTALGTAIGVPIFGAVFDKTGTYNFAFMSSILLLALAAGLIILALKGSLKLWEDTNARS